MVIVAMVSLLVLGRLPHLLVQVRRHVLEHVLEHGRQRRDVAVLQRAVLRGLLQRRRHLLVECLLRARVLVVRPGAQADQVLLQPRDRVAEREMRPVVGRPVARRVVGGGMRAGAVGHPFDQRRPQVAPRAFGRPARGREHGQEVVAVHAQRRDACAHAARGEGGAFAAGDGLEGGDRPLVVDHVQDHRRAVDMGEGQARCGSRPRRWSRRRSSPRRSWCRP